jgi:hypothetical protein
MMLSYPGEKSVCVLASEQASEWSSERGGGDTEMPSDKSDFYLCTSLDEKHSILIILMFNNLHKGEIKFTGFS